MPKLSHLAGLARVLLGGIAARVNCDHCGYAHPGVAIWCRASTLLMLREREANR